MRLAIFALAWLARAAAADPYETGYVRAGVMYGVDAESATAAGVLDAGIDVFRRGWFSVWAHVLGADGGQEAGDATTNHDYTQRRGGGEIRACTRGGIACGVVGVDAGYRTLQTVGEHGEWDGAIVTPRFGIDVGYWHVRLELTFDKIYDRYGGDGGLLTGGIAARF